jgi:hypothetical protein
MLLTAIEDNYGNVSNPSSHLCTKGLVYVVPVIVSDFDVTLNFWQILVNKFHENPSVMSAVIACGRTDGHDEASSRFSANPVQEPKRHVYDRFCTHPVYVIIHTVNFHSMTHDLRPWKDAVKRRKLIRNQSINLSINHFQMVIQFA